MGFLYEHKKQQRRDQRQNRRRAGGILIKSAEGTRSYIPGELPSIATSQPEAQAVDAVERTLPTESTQNLIRTMLQEPYFKALIETRADGKIVRIAGHVLMERALDAMQIPRDGQETPSIESITALALELPDTE